MQSLVLTDNAVLGIITDVFTLADVLRIDPARGHRRLMAFRQEVPEAKVNAQPNAQYSLSLARWAAMPPSPLGHMHLSTELLDSDLVDLIVRRDPILWRGVYCRLLRPHVQRHAPEFMGLIDYYIHFAIQTDSGVKVRGHKEVVADLTGVKQATYMEGLSTRGCKIVTTRTGDIDEFALAAFERTVARYKVCLNLCAMLTMEVNRLRGKQDVYIMDPMSAAGAIYSLLHEDARGAILTAWAEQIESIRLLVTGAHALIGATDILPSSNKE
jgi:hypothetical protein